MPKTIHALMDLWGFHARKLHFIGPRHPFIPKLSFVPFWYKVGPLPVINGVITPISRVITPVTHL